MSWKRLDSCLDEFTFRFNQRMSGQRGKLFCRLAQQRVEDDPLRYRAIAGRPEVE